MTFSDLPARQALDAVEVRRDRARQVMAHRHRGALGHQQKRRGLSDDLGMTDHHDLEAVQVEPGGLDQLDRGGCRTRRQRQRVVDDVADGRGVHALDVLQRMDGGRQRPAVNVRGYGTLQNNPEDVRIVIHGDDARFALVLGERAWPPRVLEAEADFLGGVRLCADVDGGLFLLADVDGDETSDLMGRRGCAHARRHVGENTVTDGPAVQEPIVCRHDVRCLHAQRPAASTGFRTTAVFLPESAASDRHRHSYARRRHWRRRYVPRSRTG